MNIDTLCVGYLQLQDEVLVSDRERIKTTQSNVKMVTYHISTVSRLFTWYSSYKKLFDFYFTASKTFASTYLSVYWKVETEGAESSKTHVEGEREIVTLKISSCLCQFILQSNYIYSCGLACALEGDEDSGGLRGEGFPVTLNKRRGRTVWEANWNNKTGLCHFYQIQLFEVCTVCYRTRTWIYSQVKGPGAELSRRVQSLQTICRAQANSFSAGSSIYLPGSTKIDEQSLIDMQEVWDARSLVFACFLKPIHCKTVWDIVKQVLQQETEAIGRLGNVLKRDMRDMEIMVAEDTEMTEDT